MNRLRVLLLAAVVWLLLLFILADPRMLAFTPSPAVFGIAVATVLAMLIFPDLGTSRLQMILVGVGLLYLATGAVGLLGHSLTDVPVVVTELFMLAVTVYLVRMLSVVVSNLEQIIENVITGKDDSRVLSPAKGEETVNAELFRARRFNRPVGFIFLN